jgi:hypothetical protein
MTKIKVINNCSECDSCHYSESYCIIGHEDHFVCLELEINGEYKRIEDTSKIDPQCPLKDYIVN